MLGRLHQELYLLYLGSEQMVLTSAQNINDQSHPVVPLQVPKFPSQRLQITKLLFIVLKTIEREVRECNSHKTGQYLGTFCVKLSS